MIQLGRYAVHIEPGLLDRIGTTVVAAAPAYRYAIITDHMVGELYGERVRRSFGDSAAKVYSFKAGETHKTRKTWAALTDALLADGFGRDSTVVALGGGVTGDLAGFVAATFMRGVPVVQAPTTLLAMVDASVGGKTGVDVPAGKNLVGAFHWPAAVLIDPEVLGTLPSTVLREGFAEAIKHGVIADAEYLERTLKDLPRLTGGGFDRRAMSDLIAGSVRIKASVVEADEREAGRRQILNCGHTIAHAVEQVSGYAVAHGDAVAIGLVVEARIAELTGVAASGLMDVVRAATKAAGLPTHVPANITGEAISIAARTDKKARAGVIHFALPAAIGRMAGESGGWSVPVPEATIVRAWSDLRE